MVSQAQSPTYSGTVTQTQLNGGYTSVSFNQTTHPMNSQGWVHITDNGMDVWIGVGENADPEDLPETTEGDKYCVLEEDTHCPYARGYCPPPVVSCDWEFHTAKGDCYKTTACN